MTFGFQLLRNKPLSYSPQVKKQMKNLAWAKRVLFSIYAGLAFFATGLVAYLLNRFVLCRAWHRPEALLFKFSFLAIFALLMVITERSLVLLLSGKLDEEFQKKLATFKEGQTVTLNEALETPLWRRAIFLIVAFAVALTALLVWFFVLFIFNP